MGTPELARAAAAAALMALGACGPQGCHMPQRLSPAQAANETQALDDVVLVLAAEQRYARDNDGAFGPLRCLAAPVSCGAPAGSTPYLDNVLARAPVVKGGYRRVFVGGKARSAPRADSMAGFVYLAMPEDTTSVSRAYAADGSGRVCAAAALDETRVGVEGLPPGCREVVR